MTFENAAASTEIRDGKAVFDGVYNGDDPRAYFETLGSLDYVIPHYGQQVFPAVLAAEADQRGIDTPRVLDVCCSYGVNAALLSCDLSLSDLEERYRAPEVAELSSEELASRDRDFYGGRRLPGAPAVSGLDVSERAIRYALQVGLLDEGVAEDLEQAPASPEVASLVAQADMITVTGGVGYVTARTFAHLYDVAGDEPPWLATFTLRRFSYHDIADTLAERGMVTERLAGATFPQRRFSSDRERDFTLRHLEQAGLDVTGREATGRFHTDFYLSRPEAEVAERPLGQILPGLATGVQRV